MELLYKKLNKLINRSLNLLIHLKSIFIEFYLNIFFLI